MSRKRLFRQFFGWIMLSHFLAVATTLSLGVLIFERGSGQAVQHSTSHFLMGISNTLARYYAHYGRWDEVVANKQLWWMIAVPHLAFPNPDGSPITAEQMEFRYQQLPLPMPKEHINPFYGKSLNHSGSPLLGFGTQRPILHRSPNRPANTFLLYDAQGHLLRGQHTGMLEDHFAELNQPLSPEDRPRRPTLTKVSIMLDGNIVGFIACPPPPHFEANLYETLWNTAPHTLIVGILAMFLLSALSALWVSNNLSRPLHRISQTLRQLASGAFNHRVPPIKTKAYKPIADDINFLAHALAESKETRQRWINDISHELRTPVSILNAEVESAQAGIQPPSGEMLQSMREEIGQLNTLIGDLKTLAHLDLGGLHFERRNIALAELLQQYGSKAAPALHKQDITFEWQQAEASTETILFADDRRLRQVFDNLLQNSLRYTDSGGNVRLSAAIIDNQLRLVWEDSAPAVPDESLPLLFERLYRVEQSRNRATGGSGLGLSICRSIIEAEGGRIIAKHSDLGGLAIEIRFNCP